jgi:hypothetical protein
MVQEKLFAQKTNTLSLNIADLNNGIYFLRVLTSTGAVTKKIMVTHE